MIDTPFSLQAETARLSAAGTPPSLGSPANIERMREGAREFEAFFLSQMMQPMFSNLGADEPFGGGMAENMWQSLQVEEYGRAIARAGGVGIADVVVGELLRVQEQAEGMTR